MKKLTFLTLVNGTHVIGQAESKEEIFEVDMPMQFLPLRDQNARVVRATLEPYGHVGFFAPLVTAYFEHIHVLQIREDIPESLANQYAEATGAIQIATPQETSKIIL